MNVENALSRKLSDYYDFFHHTLFEPGERRGETFSGLDMALFVDAGKVFPRRSQWNFTDLEGSVGFGLRFNARNNVFLRLDVGFSHEGFQVWVKFNNIFSEGPGGSAAAQSIF